VRKAIITVAITYKANGLHVKREIGKTLCTDELSKYSTIYTLLWKENVQNPHDLSVANEIIDGIIAETGGVA
jgi:hypothetical protein